MKTADLRPGARGRLKHRNFGRAAAVDHGHALAPFEAGGNCGNRIVGNGDENQVAAINHILRVRSRPATSNPCRQLFGRSRAAAGGGADALPALRHAPSKALGYAAGADKADARQNLILLLHLVNLSRRSLSHFASSAQDCANTLQTSAPSAAPAARWLRN